MTYAVTQQWSDIIKEYLDKLDVNNNDKLKKMREKLERYYCEQADIAAKYPNIPWKNGFPIQGDCYNTWINHLLIQLNNDISVATHIAKLTHSSSKASSLCDSVPDTDPHYLTTSALRDRLYDGTYPTAAQAGIAKFLLLRRGNEVLGECLCKDATPLADFARNEAELEYWQQAFPKRLSIQPTAHMLAKQVYFPIGAGEYHLLVVLKSSSLIQAIYECCLSKAVRDAHKTVSKQYGDKKFSQEPYITYPKKLMLSHVKSQPQNVSTLSSSRHGEICLFSCQPPHWQSQLKPPRSHTCFNDYHLNTQCRDDIDGLHQLLFTFQSAGISMKEPARLRGIVNRCRAIAEKVIDYAQALLDLPPGWSADSQCRLSINYQYFLDPYRPEDAFQNSRKHTDWHVQITDEFAVWLNARLQKKTGLLQIDSEHSRIWRSVFARMIRQYRESLATDDEIHLISK